MTIDVLIRGSSAYKDSNLRSSSSPSRLSFRSGMISEDDRRRILTSQFSVESQTPSITEPRGITFLTVPTIIHDSRRPSTADIVIEKLQVEKLEGGGLTISGVVLTANCHISLIIFGLFFLLAGVVLTYVGFATVHEHETKTPDVAQAAGAPDEEIDHSHNHQQMKIIGPIFIILGITMVILGTLLCSLNRKVSRDEKERRIANSTAQLTQMENSFLQSHASRSTSPIHTAAPLQNEDYPILSLRRGSWWMEPTPVEHPEYENVDPSYDVDSFGGASRCSSPALNNTQVWTRPDSVTKQGPPAMSTKRLTSPHINLYYGDGTTMDIATFPSEDYDLASTYPGRVPLYDISQNRRRESIISQRFEVTEAVKKTNENSEPKPLIPIITVSNSPEAQISTTEVRREANEKVVNNIPTITTNQSLGSSVELPRLSRHSVRIETPNVTRKSQTFE